jgi:hypothetical protein
VLHAKPQPIGPWSCCSTHLHGISDPPALLLCPTRAVLPQTPTPQNCSISVGQALKAGDPQTFMISARPHTPGACTALQDLCSDGPCPQGLPHQRYKHARFPFCWATPPRLAQPCRNSISLGWASQPCMTSALLGHTPKACHPEIQTGTVFIPLDHDPKARTGLQELYITGP